MKSIQLLVDARGRARRSGFYDETSWADWCNFNAMSGELARPASAEEAYDGRMKREPPKRRAELERF